MSFAKQNTLSLQVQAQAVERKSRKTFATATLRKINSHVQYYKKVLNNPNINIEQLERIRKKYEKDLKIGRSILP